MTCDICGQELIPLGTACGICVNLNCDHHQRPSPLGVSRCFGCYKMLTDMEIYVYNKTGHVPMGDWISGWLKEILADPTRYR